jgi:L-lactate dehydrogenase complex protein LldG
MGRVRRALGRTGGMQKIPPPPAISEPVARLVHTEFGLPELFAQRAEEMKMGVSRVYVEELVPRVVEFLRGGGIKKIAMPSSKLLDQLEVFDGLVAAGFEVKRWGEMTLDELYDGYDCGLTDANYAVAETGTLAIKPGAGHGRGLTLVPMVHVAVIEPKNFVPDWIDLMEKIAADPERHNWIMISGPSKTADIEMNVVTGVHGPNVVQVFILQ